MDSTLLIKLVLLAASTWSAQVTCTTPTTVPQKDEQAKYKVIEKKKFRFGEDGISMLHAVTASKVEHTSYFF